MDVYKLKNLPQSERETILIGESATVEEQTYLIPIDEPELSVIKDDLSMASVKKAYIDEEIRQAKEEFKARLEPLVDKISESIESLKSRSKKVTGKVYSLPDFENKMMHAVDSLGNVLNSRPLKPEERQRMIEYPLTKQA